MSKYLSFLLFLAAIIPGAVAEFGDPPPIMYIAIGIFLIFFLGVVGTMVYCWCHPNSYQRRMMNLQERAMEAQIRHIENAPAGTVFPIYNFSGRHMHNQMLANPQFMVSSGIPGQQAPVYPMTSAGGPLGPPGMGMPPAYTVTVKPPEAS